MGRIFVLRVVIFATLSNLQPKNSVLSSFLEKVSKRYGVHTAQCTLITKGDLISAEIR